MCAGHFCTNDPVAVHGKAPIAGHSKRAFVAHFPAPIGPLSRNIKAPSSAFGSHRKSDTHRRPMAPKAPFFSDVALGCKTMFHWFRQISVTARLRGLILMSALAMLSVALGLLWAGYQQRLMDRQSTVRQAIELAHASVQWAYAQQQLGKFNMGITHKQALMALDKVRYDSGEYFWLNELNQRVARQPARSPIDDLQTSLAIQMAITVSVVVAVSLLLWSLLEITARDLRPAVDAPAKPKAMKQARLATVAASMSPKVGANGHAVTPAPYRATLPDPADEASASNQAESPTQMVSRLRMAGAI